MAGISLSIEILTTTRLRIGRLLMRANIAVERHASKIYTRAMLEQFGHILYESGAHQVEEIEKHKTCCDP